MVYIAKVLSAVQPRFFRPSLEIKKAEILASVSIKTLKGVSLGSRENKSTVFLLRAIFYCLIIRNEL